MILLNRLGRLQLANILPWPAPIVGLRNAISELSAKGAETQGDIRAAARLLPVGQCAPRCSLHCGGRPEPGRHQPRRRQVAYEIRHPASQRL